MDTPISVWDYYKPSFVDPLYKPYQSTNVIISGAPLGGVNGDLPRAPPGVVSVRTARPFGTENTVDSNGGTWNVRPELVRAGWGLSFQRKFASDPCPLGWESRGDGWCVKMKPLYEGTFYSDEAPGVKPYGTFMPLDMRSGNPAGRRSFFPTEETYVGRAPRANYGQNVMRFGYARMPAPNSYLETS